MFISSHLRLSVPAVAQDSIKSSDTVNTTDVMAPESESPDTDIAEGEDQKDPDMLWIEELPERLVQMRVFFVFGDGEGREGTSIARQREDCCSFLSQQRSKMEKDSG